jgi:hypothetical protein
MKKNSHLIIFTIAMTFLFINCGKELKKHERIIKKSEEEEIKLLLDRILEINRSTPESFSADFTVDGRFHKNKKFKSIGKVTYKKEPQKMRISFIDYVFKSPITTIVQDGNVLKFYLPVEKKLYLDNTDTVNLKNYIGINLKFNFIYKFIIGEIPLIENYKVKQGLIAKANSKREEEETYIILENSEYYETISLKNNIPNKVLLINKITTKRYEFYLENPSCKDNWLNYRSLKFISKENGHRAIIRITSMKCNIPVNIKKITRIKVSKNTKIIKVQ